MKRFLYAFIILVLAQSCHQIPDYENDNRGNFDALWKIIDTRYCFFNEKDIDWNDVYSRYSAKVTKNMTGRQLFDLCSEMIDELHDGHTNLMSPYATSYYRKWWSEYPQNYNARLIQQYYFNFNYNSLGYFDYGLLSENIGYIHYSSFEGGIGKGNLDYLLNYFAGAQALIIDIRDNGGGDLTNVEDLVNRFISKRTLAGYIIHKTGPGHNDFSEPYAYYINPAGQGHITWRKPLVILTNRSTFSAANNFVSIMKFIPGVTIVGSTTGGGSGMPFSYELPNGWGIRFSGSSILDCHGNTTEFGIEPTEGCAVDMDPMAALEGHDTILDFAIQLISSQTIAPVSER